MSTAVKDKTFLHAFIGAAAGVGWYLSTAALLSGSAAASAILPVGGAVTLTAMLPVVLRRRSRQDLTEANPTLMAQRLAVFANHHGAHLR